MKQITSIWMGGRVEFISNNNFNFAIVENRLIHFADFYHVNCLYCHGDQVVKHPSNKQLDSETFELTSSHEAFGCSVKEVTRNTTLFI